MADLALERTLNAPIERVYDFVTKPYNLTKWWGPEGMTIPEGDLDFTRLGPWDSVMMNGEGQRFKVSGEVLEITPTHRIVFTWAWHDDADARGHESTVTIELSAQGEATLFRLTHAGLSSDDAAQNHEKGWTSTLNKLEKQDI